MKHVLIMPFVLFLFFAVAVWTVYGLHDRSTFVPPPENIVESFMRHLYAGRYDQAAHFLEEDTAKAISTDTLEDYASELKHEDGDVYKIDGECLEMSGDTSTARAILVSKDKKTEIKAGLVNEKGLWKIAKLEGTDW